MELIKQYLYTWNSRFVVQNVKLGKIWPCRFNGLKKTKLEPKFEVSISKNIETGQQSSYQKIWKIALSGPKNSVPKNIGPKNFGPKILVQKILVHNIGQKKLSEALM